MSPSKEPSSLSQQSVARLDANPQIALPSHKLKTPRLPSRAQIESPFLLFQMSIAVFHLKLKKISMIYAELLGIWDMWKHRHPSWKRLIIKTLLALFIIISGRCCRHSSGKWRQCEANLSENTFCYRGQTRDQGGNIRRKTVPQKYQRRRRKEYHRKYQRKHNKRYHRKYNRKHHRNITNNIEGQPRDQERGARGEYSERNCATEDITESATKNITESVTKKKYSGGENCETEIIWASQKKWLGWT